MGFLSKLLGLAPAPVTQPAPVGADVGPQHVLDEYCAEWGCTYERLREWLPNGDPGDVQITLIRGGDRVSGRGATTAQAAHAAMQRGELLWGTAA